MKDEGELLQRYLDGELSALEAEQFGARLAHSPELAAQLADLQQIGDLLRDWADGAQASGAALLEPTLRRVLALERQRARHAALGFAMAAVLVVALPFVSQAHVSHPVAQLQVRVPSAALESAAIERIEAGDKQAQVFVVGAARTPVVWLSDDDGDEVETSVEQDPG